MKTKSRAPTEVKALTCKFSFSRLSTESNRCLLFCCVYIVTTETGKKQTQTLPSADCKVD